MSLQTTTCGLVPHRNRAGREDTLVCKMAERIEEWEAASRLVYDCYLEAGLIRPNPFACRVLPHQLVPATNTFVAFQHGQLVLTTTLIGDSSFGLPLEQIYPAEIERQRLQGLTLAEVSCLANHTASRRSFLEIFQKLMRVLGQHSRRFGIDQLVIATHPRHACFYERTMGFRRLGPERQYPTVQNAPAVACYLDFDEVDRTRPPWYDAIFADPIPLDDLLPRPMPPEAVAYFDPMTDGVDECLPLLVSAARA